MPVVSVHQKTKDILCMVVMVGVATIIGYVFRSFRFPETNIVGVYIRSVILTARLTDGYVYAIAGMPVFDGIFHAMCSLSTGGF